METRATPNRPAEASLTPGAYFRDDFNDGTINEARWAINDNDGLVVVRNGRLVMVGLGSEKYPQLISRLEVLPATGACYLELQYEVLWEGSLPGLNLDYSPVLEPDEPKVSTPWLSTGRHYSGLTVLFNPFGGGSDFNASEPNTGVPGRPHTFRLEFDDSNNCRVLVDDLVVASRKGPSVRPLRFWLGNHLLKASERLNWAKFAVDYIEGGPLTAPKQARATPTPAPVVSASPPPPAAPAVPSEAATEAATPDAPPAVPTAAPPASSTPTPQPAEPQSSP